MNKLNKRWTTWICILLAVSMLAGCSGSGGSDEAKHPGTGEAGEIRLSISRCLQAYTMKFLI